MEIVDLVERIGKRNVARVRAAKTDEELRAVLDDLGSHARPTLVWMLCLEIKERVPLTEPVKRFLGVPEGW